MAPVNMDIVDAVQHLLDQDGTLQKIRAQLKNNVVNVLKDRHDLNTQLNVNQMTQDYLKGNNGNEGNEKKAIAKLSIVYDFLKTLGLTNTLSVLESEIGNNGGNHMIQNRTEILHSLGMPPSMEKQTDTQIPILDTILQGGRLRNPSPSSSTATPTAASPSSPKTSSPLTSSPPGASSGGGLRRLR